METSKLIRRTVLGNKVCCLVYDRPDIGWGIYDADRFGLCIDRLHGTEVWTWQHSPCLSHWHQCPCVDAIAVHGQVGKAILSLSNSNRAVLLRSHGSWAPASCSSTGSSGTQVSHPLVALTS